MTAAGDAETEGAERSEDDTEDDDEPFAQWASPAPSAPATGAVVQHAKRVIH